MNNKIQHDKFTDEVSLKIKLLSESNGHSRDNYEKCLEKYKIIFSDLSIEQENSVKQMIKEIIENQRIYTQNLIEMFATNATVLDKQKENLNERYLNMFQQVSSVFI